MQSWPMEYPVVSLEPRASGREAAGRSESQPEKFKDLFHVLLLDQLIASRS